MGIFLVVATVLAYQPVWHAGFIWDDDFYVTNNLALRSLDGLRQIWFSLDATPQYYPLVHTSFWLEYHLWGLNPLGYHVVNVLLQSLAAILLWCVLVRLQLPGAWLAAAIFALHPVGVETVAWVTERKNVLAAVFYFASALAYWRWSEQVADGNAQIEGSQRWYMLAFTLFVAALLSKTVACSLPAAMLLVIWLKRGCIIGRDVWPLLPFFAIGMTLGLVTSWLERTHVGAQGPEWAFSFPERCLIAGRAVWFYAGKLFWPADLTFIYPRWQLNAGELWQWIFPIAALGLAAALWCLRQRIGRGPLVAVLFFGGTLLPALGFANVYPMRYSFVADHFQYLASVGLIVPAAAGITKAFGLLDKRNQWVRTAICGVLLLTLGVLTWRQCWMYEDDERLWRTTIDRNPGCWMAYDNLDDVLFDEGRVNESIVEARKSLVINPDDAVAYNNLGNALLRLGHADQAILNFQRVLAIKPDNTDGLGNLGNALLQKGQTDEAMVYFQRALAIQPDDYAAEYNLGTALLRKGRVDESIVHLQKALAIRPDLVEACNNLGTALVRKGLLDGAIVQFQMALAIQPGFVSAQGGLAHIAWVLATSPDSSARNGTKAVELAQQTDGLSGGNNPIIGATLAAAYAEAGHFPEAISTAQRALRFANSQNNTALVAALEAQIKLYQAGSPFHLTGASN
jgi:tetratricopeptide (TPR) repeat protein